MAVEPDFEGAAALRAAVREFNTRTEDVVRVHGLTPEQYQLLLLIRVSPQEKATIGQLYKSLRRGQSAVTQLARRMENRGLITRELSREDARIRYIRLTKRGERLLTDAVTALEGERTRLLALIGRVDGRARAAAASG